jgi:tetratricopeptide (TPR) repeat protein
MLRRRLAGNHLVVAIEDAQWLDASSLALLEYLSKHLSNVLCVFATRPGETRLSRRLPNARALEVAALDEPALTRLVLDLAGAEAVSAPLLQAVVRDTRGNPLHCIELVRGLLGSGRVLVQGGALVLVAGSSGELPIPGTLEELILARFDALSSPTRQALRAASVMGVAFDLRVMRVVLGSLMTPEQLDLALGEGVARRMIRANDSHEFEHASFRSVVYSLLLPSEQRALHERTALALQSVYGERLQPIAARLAHHWVCAGNAGNAAEFSALAADLALQGYANVDAEHLFRQALEQDHVLRGPLSVDLRRARWSISMAQALYSQSRHAAARAAYERALAWTGTARPGGLGQLLLNIVRAVGGTYLRRFLSRPLSVVSGEQREHRLAAIRVIHAWATLDIWEGLLPQAANKAVIAYRLAESVVDAPEAAEIISGLGYMLATTPGRRHAHKHLVHALALAETTADLQACTSTSVLLGMYFVLDGQTSRAEEPLRAAVALANRLGSGLWRHRAHFALAEWLLFAGRLEAAALAFEEAANVAAAAEPPVQGFANCMAALALMRRGELERAYRVVTGETGLELLEAECLVLQRFTSLGISAEIALRCGHVAEALTLADRALELSRTRRDVNVFFAALHGHAGTVFVFAGCLERLSAAPGTSLAGWDSRTLRRKLKQALARLAAFGGMYPGARACVEQWRARYDALRSRTRAARTSWSRAVRLASAAEQPYEQIRSLRALAAYEPAKAELAEALARRHGIPSQDLSDEPSTTAAE